jgi:hypothetical protein
MITITIPKNSRCLVIEDSENRLQWFTDNVPGCVTAVSPQEAVMVIDTNPRFDIVFLDHDAGNQVFVDPTDPDFLSKSFWRAAQRLRSIDYDGYVIIHSHNPVGADRMAALLKSAKVTKAPFGTFVIKKEE